MFAVCATAQTNSGTVKTPKKRIVITASMLLEAGTHPKVVQDLLGHSTIQLTLDTYSHVLPLDGSRGRS